MPKQLQPDRLPSLLLRAGLAFVLAYAAISSLREPAAWTGFVPPMLTTIISAEAFLKLFALFQLGVAAALVTGKYVRYAAGLAALSMIGLLVFNFNALIVTFRDVGLVCMAAALYFLEK